MILFHYRCLPDLQKYVSRVQLFKIMKYNLNTVFKTLEFDPSSIAKILERTGTRLKVI